MAAQITSTYGNLSGVEWDNIIEGSIGSPVPTTDPAGGITPGETWRGILQDGGAAYEENLQGLDPVDINIQKSKAKATELKKLMRSQCIYTGTSSDTSTNIDTIKTISGGGDVAVAGISEGAYLSNTYVDSMRSIIDYYGSDNQYQSLHPSQNGIINAGRGDIDVMPFDLSKTGTDTADNWLYQYNNLYYPSSRTPQSPQIRIGDPTPNDKDWSCMGLKTAYDVDCAIPSVAETGYESDLEKLQECEDNDKCHIVVHDLREHTDAPGTVPVKDDLGRGLYGRWDSKDLLCGDSKVCSGTLDSTYISSLGVDRTTLTDTVNCDLVPSPDFGTTDGSCTDTDSAVAACAYVAGSANAALDGWATPDSCTSTTAAPSCQDYYSQLINESRAFGQTVSSVGDDVDNPTAQQAICERRIEVSGDGYNLGQDSGGRTGCKYRNVPEYYKDLNLVDKCSISDLHKKLKNSGMTSTDIEQIEFTGQCPRRQIGHDLKWICSDQTGRYKSNNQAKADCRGRKDCIDPDFYRRWVAAGKPEPGAEAWDTLLDKSGHTVTAGKLENECSWRPVIERAEYVEEDSPCVLRCKGGSIQSGGQPYCDPPPDFLQGSEYAIGYLYPYLNPEWNTNDFSCTYIDEKGCGEGDGGGERFQRTLSWDSDLNRHTIKTTTCPDFYDARPESPTDLYAGHDGWLIILIGLIGIGLCIFSINLRVAEVHWFGLTGSVFVACALIYNGVIAVIDRKQVRSATLIGFLVLYFVLLFYSGALGSDVLNNQRTALDWCGEAQYWVWPVDPSAAVAAKTNMTLGLPPGTFRPIDAAVAFGCNSPLFLLTGLFVFGQTFGFPILVWPILALMFFVLRLGMGKLYPDSAPTHVQWLVAWLGAGAIAALLTAINTFLGDQPVRKFLIGLENAPDIIEFVQGGRNPETDKGQIPPNKCKVYSDCKYDDNCIWDEIVSIIDDSQNYHYSSPSTEMMEVIYGFTYIIHKHNALFTGDTVKTFTTPFYDTDKNSNTYSKLERLGTGSNNSNLREWMDGWDPSLSGDGASPIEESLLGGDHILLMDLLRDTGLSLQELKELFIYYWDLLHDGTTGKLRGIDSNGAEDSGLPGEIWDHSSPTESTPVIRGPSNLLVDLVYSRPTETSDVADDERTRKGLPIIRLLLKDWINRNMSLSQAACHVDKVCKYGKDESDKCKSACYNDEILDYSGAKCMTIDPSGSQSDLFADKMGHDSTSFRKLGPNFQRFYCELESFGDAPGRNIRSSDNTYEKMGCQPNDLINNDAIRGERCGDYLERTEASGYNIDCNSAQNINHIKELGHNNQEIRALQCWTQEGPIGLTNPAKNKICGFTDDPQDPATYIWENDLMIDSSNIDPRGGDSIFNPAAVGIGGSGAGYSEVSPILSCCEKVPVVDPLSSSKCYSGVWHNLSADGNKGICTASDADIATDFNQGYNAADILVFANIVNMEPASFCSHFSLTASSHSGCPP
jgi:hypothetical protein